MRHRFNRSAANYCGLTLADIGLCCFLDVVLKVTVHDETSAMRFSIGALERGDVLSVIAVKLRVIASECPRHRGSPLAF